MSGFAASDPGSGGGRPLSGGGWRRSVTGGVLAGTSGAAWSALAKAYLAIAALLVLADGVNVLSVLYDAARAGRGLAAWEPITWEFSSGVGAFTACGLIYLALRAAPPGRGPWGRMALVHGLATLAFSVVHIGVMTVLRVGVYAAAGERYRLPTPGDGLYEYRKDLLLYLVLAGVFWLFRRPQPKAAEAVPAPAAPPPSAAPSFDILEGARTLRTPVRAILAVRAAGNYVEFVLEGGGRPLMRASLAETEAALAAHGFLRTHRSWIVNPARLSRLEPAGSGDYRVGLDGGAEAPLSRRFPAALERLRIRRIG